VLAKLAYRNPNTQFAMLPLGMEINREVNDEPLELFAGELVQLDGINDNAS